LLKPPFVANKAKLDVVPRFGACPKFIFGKQKQAKVVTIKSTMLLFIIEFFFIKQRLAYNQ
jgi:hypothetical protein